MAITTILCRLGWHKYNLVRNDEGSAYKRCARCGKTINMRGTTSIPAA